MKDLEIISAAQRARLRRRKRVVEAYSEALQEYIIEKGYKPERMFNILANKFEMTVPGIKYILKEEGLFTSNAELKKLQH